MGNYFRIDHARKACVKAYLNLRTKSQKYGKLRDFEDKNCYVYIDIVVLDQCCCAKNIGACLWIFS